MNALVQEAAVILIIDSDPLMLTGMAAVLHMQGHQCHCAQSSEAAMKAAESLELDLIICDVKLKHESGLELCKRLREFAAEVPVLYVSANQQPDIIRRAHETGGAYYLRKPFDPAVLIELVDKALWMPHLVQSNLLAHDEATAPAEDQPAASEAPAKTSTPAHSHPAAPAPKIGSKSHGLGKGPTRRHATGQNAGRES